MNKWDAVWRIMTLFVSYAGGHPRAIKPNTLAFYFVQELVHEFLIFLICVILSYCFKTEWIRCRCKLPERSAAANNASSSAESGAVITAIRTVHLKIRSFLAHFMLLPYWVPVISSMDFQPCDELLICILHLHSSLDASRVYCYWKSVYVSCGM